MHGVPPKLPQETSIEVHMHTHSGPIDLALSRLATCHLISLDESRTLLVQHFGVPNSFDTSRRYSSKVVDLPIPFLLHPVYVFSECGIV